MQNITTCCTENGFELRLETAENSFAQEFEVDNKGVQLRPLYFETH